MNRKGMVIFCICVMLVTVLICMGVGRVTAGSFVSDVDLDDYLANPKLRIGYCDMGYGGEGYPGLVEYGEVKNVDDLIYEDTVVIKVKLNTGFKRKIYNECILSKVNVISVYKGDLKEGDVISVFEPVDCLVKDYMQFTDGYSLIEKEPEYIMFLKPLKNSGYTKEKFVYAPVSTMYGKFAIQDKQPKLFKEADVTLGGNELLYKNIKEEIYLYDKNDYNQYVKLKKEVLRDYN